MMLPLLHNNNHNNKKKAMKQQLPISVIYENQLVIRIPHSRVLQLLARSVLLGILIVSFPWIESIVQIAKKNASLVSNVRNHNNHIGLSTTPIGIATPPMDSSAFPLLFNDLINEGIYKSGYKTVFLTSGDLNNVATQQVLIDNDIDLVSESDPQRLTSIPQDTFDFIVSSSGFSASEFIHRTLKVGGVVVVQLHKDPSQAFNTPSNYKIVYVRRFDTTVFAMRKTSPSDDKLVNPSPGRRLLGFESEAKKAALDGLEDVILEPPRSSSTEYKNYLRKTKYLPELTGDTLGGYPRRVFIEVAFPGKSGNGDSIQWFKNNYPTRNRVFDMYNIEMVADSSVQQVGVSDWLRKNVKQEEYVVMKAEADVVEEMVNSRAIGLVDELFFECKHQWQKGKKNKGKRAYWECLALYGRLRDEGIAVHQWWA